MREAFRINGFPRLFAGLSTSAFGDSIMLLVLSMWVKTLTGSNAAAGMTFFFMVLPALFAPLFGVWIDRVRRRPLLVWGNVASAIAVLPLVLVRDAEHVWVIYCVSVLYGISFVVLPAGTNGLLKELVPAEALADANASLQSVKEAFRLVGPLAGAALFAWQGGWVVAALDALSFLLAAVIIASIRMDEHAPVADGDTVRRQLTAGARFLIDEPVIKHVLVGFALMLLVVGFAEASIYALLDAFGKPPTFAGVLFMVQGIGAVVGGLLSGRVIGRIGEPAGVVLGMVMLGGPVSVVAATGSLAVVYLALIVLGAALPVLFVAFNTLIQRRTPQPIIGRVSMAVETLMGVPQAISLAVGALLVSLISYRFIFLMMGVVTLLGAAHIAFWLRATLSRALRERPALATDS